MNRRRALSIWAVLICMVIAAAMVTTSGASATPVTPTATPTSVVLESLNLTYMVDCDQTGNTWRVTNPNNVDIPFTFVVVGTSITGSAIATPGYMFFNTSPGNQTVIVTWDGGSKTKAGGSNQVDCPTATPSPTPTATATSTPVVLKSLNLTYMVDCDQTGNTWRVTNTNNVDIPFTFVVVGTAITGSAIATPGYMFFNTSPGNQTVKITWDGGSNTKAGGSNQVDCPTATPSPTATPTSVVLESLNLTYMVDCDQTVNTWRVTNPNSVGISYTFVVVGTAITGSGTAAPGYTFFNTSPGNQTVIVTWDGGSKTKAGGSNQSDCTTPTPVVTATPTNTPTPVPPTATPRPSTPTPVPQQIYYPQTVSCLNIIKTDPTGKRLSGWVFSYKAGSVSGTTTTDANGLAQVFSLPLGAMATVSETVQVNWSNISITADSNTPVTNSASITWSLLTSGCSTVTFKNQQLPSPTPTVKPPTATATPSPTVRPSVTPVATATQPVPTATTPAVTVVATQIPTAPKPPTSGNSPATLSSDNGIKTFWIMGAVLFAFVAVTVTTLTTKKLQAKRTNR